MTTLARASFGSISGLAPFPSYQGPTLASTTVQVPVMGFSAQAGAAKKSKGRMNREGVSFIGEISFWASLRPMKLRIQESFFLENTKGSLFCRWDFVRECKFMCC